MSYDTVEQSMQSAQIAELFVFQAPVKAFAITTHERDVAWSGTSYAAVAGSRSNLVTGDVAGNMTDLVVTLPASHALPKLYVNGVPPREIAVTAVRLDIPSGLFLQLWSGYVSGLSFRGTEASFRVPSGTADALKAQLPSTLCSRLCQHVLYGNLCTASRGGHTPSGTPYQLTLTVNAISADGTVISLSGNPFITDQVFYVHGEMLHGPSTERRTITLCGGAGDATIQVPFPASTIQVGDLVTIFAGCDHAINTCFEKFNNTLNFGGVPYLPSSNVFYVGLNAAFYGSDY